MLECIGGMLGPGVRRMEKRRDGGCEADYCSIVMPTTTRPGPPEVTTSLNLSCHLSFSVTTWWDKNKNQEPVVSRWSRVCASPSAWPASASWSAPSPWPPSSTHTSWTGSTARSYRGSPRYRFFVLFVTNKINAQKSWKFSVCAVKKLEFIFDHLCQRKRCININIYKIKADLQYCCASFIDAIRNFEYHHHNYRMYCWLNITRSPSPWPHWRASRGVWIILQRTPSWDPSQLLSLLAPTSYSTSSSSLVPAVKSGS